MSSSTVSTSKTLAGIVSSNSNRAEEAVPLYELQDPTLYINRELSLLEFNRRVLEEAQDQTHPLLERAKFLAIFSSNMDEFFMIRVAGLMQQVAAGVTETPADGLTPSDQLTAIRKIVRSNLKKMTQCYKDIQSKLGGVGVFLHTYDELTKPQQASVDRFFREEIFPILTPLAFDPGRPFPHISSLSLNLAVLVRDPDTGSEFFSRIKVPNTLPRLVSLERSKEDRKQDVYRFIWIEDLISRNLADLFPSYEIVEAHMFRITRNADMEIEADEADDLLEAIEATVRRRRFGFVVRLTVGTDIPDRVLRLLANNLDVNDEDIYESNGPLGQSGLMTLLSIDRPDLKDTPYQPVIHPRLRNLNNRQEIFDAIREGDILLHHPYESFMPVIDFLKAAARDPKVLAIKQTLYRAGKNSPVVAALMEATENGKQVSALVELKARFDEESNIGWAKALERVGVHVVYGFASLKTHTKICMVVRREDDGKILRYVHLSTGNYNAVSAQIYTDMGLFTCKPEFGEDATDLFNALTGYSKKEDYKKFLVAPLTLRKRFAALIDREIDWARQGKPAKLIFQMNSLIDAEFIRQFYQASQAGVKVDIIARGICGLRPGIAGISENIRVVSIVGRFLEHARIYYFHNGGSPDIYLGSADLMPRNLDRRIETLFPIEEPALKQRLIDSLALSLADNTNARQLHADGSYTRILPKKNEAPTTSQNEFMIRAKSMAL
ncbi:MAG: polyphosphate kinase 1 [Anaerolineae bacterium]|nr:polyphosphate kinase 1 [Anaerolineae bacterium]